MSSTRHAVVRGPSFTGLGNRPDFTPDHQVDLQTGIGPFGARISEILMKPVFSSCIGYASNAASLGHFLPDKIEFELNVFEFRYTACPGSGTIRLRGLSLIKDLISLSILFIVSTEGPSNPNLIKENSILSAVLMFSLFRL